MGDPNFWKDEYEDAWRDGNRREGLVTEILRSQGIGVEDFGFAAGSTEYKEGRPEEYGYEQGDPDLRVTGTERYVEVTGTDLPVPRQASLWIRPDKIRNARDHPDRDEWVVHVLESQKLFRAVHLTDDVVDDLLEVSAERRIYPYINGNEEEYVAVSPVETDLVEPVEAMVNYLSTGSRRRGPLSVPTDPDWAALPDETLADVSDGDYAHICVRVVDVEDRPFAKAATSVTVEDADGERFDLVVWENNPATLREYQWTRGEWYYLDGPKGNEFNGMNLSASSSMSVTPLDGPPT